MKASSKAAIQRLRVASFIEGLSWLALIAAMVLRATHGMNEAVSWTGRVHGGLFIVFCILLALAWRQNPKWSFTTALLLFLSSLVPLGFIFAEKWLGKAGEELAAELQQP